MLHREQGEIKVLAVGTAELWLTAWSERADVRLADALDWIDGTDLVAALARHEPDAVAIATPPHRKTPIGMIEQIVRRGCDVVLEKLRPAHPDDGQRLRQLSDIYGRRIIIGEGYRYDPCIERVKQMLDAGAIGRAGQIVWSCYRPAVQAAWMDAYRHVMLEDLTYHHLGVLHYLFELQWTKVYAHSYAPAWRVGHSPGIVSMIADSKQGIRLSYHASWAAHGKATSWPGSFRIEGSEGAIHYEYDRVELTDRQGIPHAVEPVHPFPNAYCKGIIAAYVDSVRAGTVSDLAISRFLPALRLIYAAVESAECGQAVSID